MMSAIDARQFMTIPQKTALKWFRDRGGDGVFDKNGVLVVSGERAPFMRATWNALHKLKLVEQYLDRRRMRLTTDGKEFDVGNVDTSDMGTFFDKELNHDD